MGIGPSHLEEPSRLVRPEGLKQLNGSVWELFRPEGVPKVEVIFFHGLQLSDYKEAFWRTWRSRDDTLVWPTEWLGPSLQNARISSISYDSSARQTSCSGVSEMYQIIENLMQDVVLSPNFNIDQNSTVIMVGHSMGGLIIKQLLLKCLEEIGYLSSDDHTQASQKKRIETFLDNCRGVFYYSTPHAGSELVAYADVAKHMPGAHLNMEIIDFLRVLSSQTARINNKFSRARHNKRLATRAIGELHDTQFAGLSRRVVPEASARQDVDNYYSEPANHFEVCKAENNTSSSIFLHLKQFCESCAAADEVPEFPPVPTHEPRRPLSALPTHEPLPKP